MSSEDPGKNKRPSAKRPTKRRKGGARAGRPDLLADGEKGTRLQKFLANAGVDSRRNCEELIRTGRVTVDGAVVSNPAVSVHPEQQDVRLDGERLRLPQHKYYLINKPKGVVCTTNDPAGRPRAVDLVPNHDHKLFTVGRLDENTQGLMLITNDGALAEHLAHPRYEVVRRYRAQVVGIPDAATLAELRKGMHFSDGYFRFHSIRMQKRKGRSTFLELELQEGKNREIRRLLARVGHKVIHLERIAFGPIRIGSLEVGRCRELSSKELSELYDFIRTAPHSRGTVGKPNRKSTGKPSGRSTAKSTGKPAAKSIGKPTTGKPAAKFGRPAKKRSRTEKTDHEPTRSRRGAARQDTKSAPTAKKKPAGGRKGRPKRK